MTCVSDFGDKDIQTLANHYEEVLDSAGVDVDSLDVEWNELKAKLKQ